MSPFICFFVSASGSLIPCIIAAATAAAGSVVKAVGVVIHVPPLVFASAAVILRGRGMKPVGGRGPRLGTRQGQCGGPCSRLHFLLLLQWKVGGRRLQVGPESAATCCITSPSVSAYTQRSAAGNQVLPPA